MKTAMQELADNLREKVNDLKDACPGTDQYGYRAAMQMVIDDIDVEMLEMERQQLIAAWDSSCPRYMENLLKMVPMAYCNICGSDAGQSFLVEEKMLSTHKLFRYFECGACGHAHLLNPPADTTEYYPLDKYYSFKIAPIYRKTPAYKAFEKLGIKKDDIAILDYGCGSGQFVRELNSRNYWNAWGYDPYMTPAVIKGNRDHQLNNSIDYFKRIKYDLMTFHHSFEHLADPVAELRIARDMLKPGGMVQLRFPVIDSHAYELYGANWVQFDAPRHLNLFTRASFNIMLKKLPEFRVVDMYDDSTHFQFTGSEQYKKGKPLAKGFLKRLVSPKTYWYTFLANRLNKEGRGDQVVVTLHKQ